MPILNKRDGADEQLESQRSKKSCESPDHCMIHVSFTNRCCLHHIYFPVPAHSKYCSTSRDLLVRSPSRWSTTRPCNFTMHDTQQTRDNTTYNKWSGFERFSRSAPVSRCLALWHPGNCDELPAKWERRKVEPEQHAEYTKHEACDKRKILRFGDHCIF